MNEESKKIIENILNGLWYNPKSIDIVENTLNKLKEALGEGWIVAYQRPDKPDNAVKFLFAKRKTPESEYTVWTYELVPGSFVEKNP